MGYLSKALDKSSRRASTAFKSGDLFLDRIDILMCISSVFTMHWQCMVHNTVCDISTVSVYFPPLCDLLLTFFFTSKVSNN